MERRRGRRGVGSRRRRGGRNHFIMKDFGFNQSFINQNGTRQGNVVLSFTDFQVACFFVFLLVLLRVMMMMMTIVVFAVMNDWKIERRGKERDWGQSRAMVLEEHYGTLPQNKNILDSIMAWTQRGAVVGRCCRVPVILRISLLWIRGLGRLLNWGRGASDGSLSIPTRVVSSVGMKESKEGAKREKDFTPRPESCFVIRL